MQFSNSSPPALLNRRMLLTTLLVAGPVAVTAGADTAPAKAEPIADQALLESLWADLEAKEELTATRALLKFTAQPAQTTLFFKEKLKPLKIEREQIRELLAKLGSDNAEDWKPALEELEYFDPRLQFDLNTLMKDVKESPARQRMVEMMCGKAAGTLEGREVDLESEFSWVPGDEKNGVTRHQFVSRQLKKRTTWPVEPDITKLNSKGSGVTKQKWIRAVRAILLLEHFHSPESIAILKYMTQGHVDAQPTKEARLALKRIWSKE